MTEEEFKKALEELAADVQRKIKEHGAIDMISGHDFIGYIGRHENKWWCDIWSYSVNCGKIFGETREEVENVAYQKYGI
jgi:ABC-type Zn uptake system ZnuABC Zn-binding protein ZnuA